MPPITHREYKMEAYITLKKENIKKGLFKRPMMQYIEAVVSGVFYFFVLMLRARQLPTFLLMKHTKDIFRITTKKKVRGN